MVGACISRLVQGLDLHLDLIVFVVQGLHIFFVVQGLGLQLGLFTFFISCLFVHAPHIVRAETAWNLD